MHKLVLHASKEYRNKAASAEDELMAPRRIILFVIGFQVIEMAMLVYLILR